jgi:Sec-independent protein translocase protein TatA
MSNKPVESIKSEISSRKMAKFLIGLPTSHIPGFVDQLPSKHLHRIVGSMDAYTVRAALVTAYVRAIAARRAPDEAFGDAATASRAVRRALRSMPEELETTLMLEEEEGSRAAREITTDEIRMTNESNEIPNAMGEISRSNSV